MSPQLQTTRMMAILEQWDNGSGHHIAHTKEYVWILLFKCGLDIAFFSCCTPKKFTYFLNVCSLTIVLADMIMTLCFTTAWFFEAEKSFITPCFIMANASMTYRALPFPMMLFVLLDYCSEDTRISLSRAFCKVARNVILALFLWLAAIIFSLSSVYAKPMEIETVKGFRALLCEVEASTLVPASILVLCIASLLTMLPSWPKTPQRERKALGTIDAQRSEHNTSSSLTSTSSKNPNNKTPSETDENLENTHSPPYLGPTVTIGFVLFWMPYLALSISFLLCDFAVPSYVAVNLVWLECFNSFLVGLIIRARNGTKELSCRLVENVCSLHIYWQLKGIKQPQLPVHVFNPSEEKTSFQV